MSRIRDLPPVGDRWHEIERLVGGRTPAVFLDFDGTLSPIVEDPDAARLPAATRRALEELRAHCLVVIVSGRDAEDVRARVGIDGLVYAGSHGFDVIWPDGRRTERGTEYRGALELATSRLREVLADVPGVELEPKRFAVAVHHRRTPPERHDEVEDAVARVADEAHQLRRSGGKEVLELRPDLDWDKGRALLWVLTELGRDGPETLPVYLGDDLTDEDAFAALREHGSGLGLVVRGEDDDRVTAADYVIADVEATTEVLDRLSHLVSGMR